MTPRNFHRYAKKKTTKIFDRADVAILVTEADAWGNYEDEVLAEMDTRNIPVIVVINKIDLHRPSESFLRDLKEKTSRIVPVSSLDTERLNSFLDALKQLLLDVAPDDFVQPPSLVGDLLPPGGLAVLVVPIDLQAPKGRLILPQVQTIRDALDNDAAVVIVKERELPSTLTLLNRPPDVVVCDSQAILKVSADVAQAIPLTTFSILFARQKGDLAMAAEGVAHIETLQSGDRVLIAEACSHHPLQEDIGRVKIPRWLKQYVGGDIRTDVSAGRDYPENLQDYKLIIHCGGCMLTRREMLGRMQHAREAHVPVTNYGLAISFTQGVARRTLSPFPSALLAFDRKIQELQSL